MATRLVAVKLTETELQALQGLVDLGRFETLSAAMRAALMLLFEQHKIKSDARRQMRMERIQHRQRRRKEPRDKEQ